MKISISRTASAELKKTFWDMFFKSKNRGVMLQRHFPWLEDNSANASFFEATEASVSIGGLVLFETNYVIDEKNLKIGLIGLVCVVSESRGMGVASTLLKEAISHAKRNEFNYLTLWASQQKFYLPYGFYLMDNWCFGWIYGSLKQAEVKAAFSFQLHYFLENKTLPLPPFADAIYEYVADNVAFTLLKDKDGVAVVCYEGEVTEVAHKMVEVLPARWRLNVVKNDPLIHALADCGVNIDLRPVNLQMWMRLDQACVSGDLIGRIKMSVLDRI